MALSNVSAGLVAVALLSSSARPAAAQELAPVRSEVLPGVHVFVSADPGAGNSTAIVSNGEALVVDATALPGTARAIMASLDSLGVSRLVGVVNTHWHADHVLGNQSFRERHPGVPIFATDYARRMIEEDVVPDLSAQMGRIRAQLAARDEVLATGLDTDGVVLTDARRAEIEVRQGVFRTLLRGIEEVNPTLPDSMIREVTSIAVGSVTVRLEPVGAAHSLGDLIVRVPELGVVVAGDLVTEPFPAAADGYSSISGWREALSLLLTAGDRVVVPGHGGATVSREYVVELTDLLADVVGHVADGRSSGRSLVDLSEVPPSLRFATGRWQPGSRVEAAFAAFFWSQAVAIAWREGERGPR